MRLFRRFVFVAICLALLPGWAGSAVGSSAAHAGGFPVMTFNLRYDNPGDGANAWPKRMGMAASTILFHQAAVVGMQEALRGQIADLERLLPGYGWFGRGRDEGGGGPDGGEFNPVFYAKDRLRLLEQATFWLSATPDVAGSRGWDGACNRIVTWGKLEEIATGRVFHFFNTHFDHMGPVARRESAGLLLRRIAAIAGGGPAVVTGDFNCTPTEEPYRILTAAAPAGLPLRDARGVSPLPPYGGTRSFNGFDPKGGSGSIIDHIFVRGDVWVTRIGIIADKWDGRFVSDHYPVLAGIQLEPAARRIR